MAFPHVEFDIEKNEMQMWLCLPFPRNNKINKLTNAYNVDAVFNEGKVNELTLSIPLQVDMDGELVRNPLIKQFEAFYQIYVEWNGFKEYFVYLIGSRKLDSSGSNLTYKMYSSSYMIGKSLLRAYKEESRSLRYHANLMLTNTNWKLGFVDVEFDIKVRTIELAESNALQGLIELATKFGALLEFDPTKREVSFVRLESTGRNKKFTFNSNLTIESLGQELNYDNLVTRLYVSGSEGLDFRRLSPTGSNFIEDLTWLTYPFDYDKVNGDINPTNYATYNFNVTKHSKWMTDELVIAYLRYQNKLKAIDPSFKSLIEQRDTKEDEIVQLQAEYAVLETEYKIIEDALWVINKTKNEMINANELSNIENGTDVYSQAQIDRYEADRVAKVAELNAKQAQLNTKQAQIDSKNVELTNITNQINNLREQVKLENNFTAKELIEYHACIYSKSYNNDSIVNAQDLLEDGIRAFKEVNIPSVELTLDIVNFLNDSDYALVSNRIALGDTVKVKSEEIDVYVELKLIGIRYNRDSKKIGITVANAVDVQNNQNDLLKKIYSGANTASTVNLDKYLWDRGGEAWTGVNQILSNAWEAGRNAIFGGYTNTTILDSHGLKSVETGDDDTFLVINNGVLAITKDGGKSIEVAITKDGVHANRVVGKMLIGEKLVLEDSEGVWETHGSTTVIYDRNRRPSMWIGQLEPNCFGIRMDNQKHRINLSTCDGFKISKYKGSSLEDVMYADLEGNIWSKYWTHDTTNIKDSQGYFDLKDNQIVIKDGNREVMRMGYIPSGTFGGCSISSDWGVALVGTNGSNIYMTRNRGFAIDVNCVNKFSVNSQGNIFAQDIEANNLMIKSAKIGSSITINESSGITITGSQGVTVNGNTATVKMNAIDGFKITAGGQDVFYVGSDGKLYARNFYTLDSNGGTIPDDISGSFISDLTVNRLKTLTQTNRNDYIHIENTYVKFMSQGLTKLEMTYRGSGFSAYPIMIWGSGAGGGTSMGYTYKTNDRFVHEYFGTDGRRRAIEMTDMSNRGVVVTTPYGLTIDTDAGSIEISPSGISFNGAIVYPF